MTNLSQRDAALMERTGVCEANGQLDVRPGDEAGAVICQNAGKWTRYG